MSSLGGSEAGIFPNAKAALRLIGAVLEEQRDECQAAVRRYFKLGVHGDPVRGSRDGAGVACAYRGREGDGRLARQGQRGTPIYTLDGT